jgi:hypothetical protein
MPITITVQDAKFVLQLLASYQQEHMATSAVIWEKAEQSDSFTLNELRTYEKASIEIYRAGYFGDRLHEMINDAEKSN